MLNHSRFGLRTVGEIILAIFLSVLVIGYIVVAASGPELLGHEEFCNSALGARDMRCIGAFSR